MTGLGFDGAGREGRIGAMERGLGRHRPDSRHRDKPVLKLSLWTDSHPVLRATSAD